MPTKTKIRTLFKAIRHGEVAQVGEMISTDPALLESPAIAPPKKDDGQSPLQVAIKSNHPEVASLLLDLGANVNYMDSSDLNEWNIPVLHNAIRAAMSASICYTFGEPEAFDRQLRLMRRMLELGADVHAVDSNGHLDALLRARLDADIAATSPNEWSAVQVPAIAAVFQTLLDAGASPDVAHPHLAEPTFRDWLRGAGSVFGSLLPVRDMDDEEADS